MDLVLPATVIEVYWMDRSTGRSVWQHASAFAAAGPAPVLPEVGLGRRTTSRLFVGGNPAGADPYVVSRLGEAMHGYFTLSTNAAQVRTGVNTWRSRADRLATLKLLFSCAGPLDAVGIGMLPKRPEQVEENYRPAIAAAAKGQAA